MTGHLLTRVMLNSFAEVYLGHRPMPEATADLMPIGTINVATMIKYLFGIIIINRIRCPSASPV